MTMPGMVLMAQMASAPASTTARAMDAMSGTLGASLTMTGRSTARLTAAVTFAADRQLAANGSPNSEAALGQLMLTSIRSGAARATISATTAKLATVSAKMLAMTGT